MPINASKYIIVWAETAPGYTHTSALPSRNPTPKILGKRSSTPVKYR